MKARDNGLSASEIIAMERGGTIKESLNVHDTTTIMYEKHRDVDALRSRIEELEALLKLVTPEFSSTDVLSVIQEIFQLRWKDRIAELEKDKIRLANEYCELAKVWQEHECKPDVVWHKYPDEKPHLKPIPSTKLHTLLAVVSAGGDPEVEMVIVETTESMLHWRRADGGWYAPEQILYWAYLPEPPRSVTNDER